MLQKQHPLDIKLVTIPEDDPQSDFLAVEHSSYLEITTLVSLTDNPLPDSDDDFDFAQSVSDQMKTSNNLKITFHILYSISNDLPDIYF